MNNLDRVRVVLVETTHAGNIGSAARAMKTMGLSRLYLVAPRTKFPATEALTLAANAVDVVTDAVVSDTLFDAIKDCNLVIGTSARQRRIPWPMLTARGCGRLVGHCVNHQQEIAIIFGRESKGLSNNALQMCQFHVCIPGNPGYDVLNVAMAVQVLSYEIWLAQQRYATNRNDDTATPQMAVTHSRWDEPLATVKELEGLHQHCTQTLMDVGFYHPDHPKQVPARVRRLLNRQQLDTHEVQLLRGVLGSIQSLVKS